MGFEFISYEREPNNIGILAINRPNVLNALNWDTLGELREFLEDVLPKEELKALIITGAGDKAFVAGADIAQMNEMKERDFQDYVDYAHRVYELIENEPCPSIAAINGYALGGGCELALACDIRIASEKARLGFPEVKLGIFPGWGGTQRVTRVLGLGKTKELVFTGEMVNAEEALRIGLVERVVPHAEIMNEAKKLAGEIAKRGPIAVRLSKTAINAGSEMDLQKALLLEKTLVSLCFDSQDRVEGMKAFLEKREPSFTGR
ncbi:MAG TPA: enoyl-CoA hydratase-related protein [Thermodesulfobacteriota bacterium]|jgi:enoyl-CoA hydratase|nr:enoyl-CoA hydratase-related protein [Thermodesulfobacteriota bacterium]